MSGICGILKTDGSLVDRAVLEKLTKHLRWRGPDGYGVWSNGPIGFGHTLFRTAYQSNYEQQPLTLDGVVYITANARIDARDKLISMLRAGHHQVSYDSPDVELILHAYQLWGEDCLSYLLGDFAFAIWNTCSGQLFCARDHFGLRTLYYARVGNMLLFSNTIGSIRALPMLSNQLNDEAIAGFLLFGSHTWLNKSITTFAEIQQLPPAHKLIWNGRNLDVRQYWNFPINTPLLRYRHVDDYVQHFREILTTAVSDRVRTDRVVISMSGGMDSTSLAALVCRILREKRGGTQLSALTTVYDKIHPDRERYYSGLVADKLDIPIHYFVCDHYQLLMPMVKTPEPVEDHTPMMTLDIERKISQLGRVVFMGNSADNLLRYSAMTLLGMSKDTSPIWALIEFLRLRKQFAQQLSFGTGLEAKFRRQKIDCPATYPYPRWLNPAFEDLFNMKEQWELGWLWKPQPLHPRHPIAHTALVLPDWSEISEFVAGTGIEPSEIVDPYLDVRVVEFVLSLPPLPWLYNKYILRQAMQYDLPKKVINRPKTALGCVHDSLLKQPNSSWVDSWTPVEALLSYIDPDQIPSVTESTCDCADSYVNLRPLLLNIWLQQQDLA